MICCRTVVLLFFGMMQIGFANMIHMDQMPKPVHVPNLTYALDFKSKQSQSHKAPLPKAILFVSFSLSDQMLAQYLKQSRQYQIPMIMRGFIDNSFKKTAYKMYEMTKSKNQGGIAIMPDWFVKFNIDQVPALVIFSSDAHCETAKVCNPNAYDVIYGNLSIHDLLDHIVQEGTQAKTAMAILKEYANAK